MVSEITDNDINQRLQPSTQGQQQQQQQRQQPGLPPFLLGTSPEVQRKFFDIVSNRDETFQEKQNKLDALMSKLDLKKQGLYEEFRKKKDAEEKDKRSKIHSLVATMSEKAQTAFAKVSAVLTNPELKDGERWEMIQSVYGKMDEDVKKEFNDRFGSLI
uniref:SXP/RAL-2 family protein Ani s 5-like cation-binding domain-containing protein n=2 Tax=Parascaris TaxID=6254 RepID=A0A915B6Q4_PARUN